MNGSVVQAGKMNLRGEAHARTRDPDRHTIRRRRRQAHARLGPQQRRHRRLVIAAALPACRDPRPAP